MGIINSPQEQPFQEYRLGNAVEADSEGETPRTLMSLSHFGHLCVPQLWGQLFFGRVLPTLTSRE